MNSTKEAYNCAEKIHEAASVLSRSATELLRNTCSNIIKKDKYTGSVQLYTYPDMVELLKCIEICASLLLVNIE